MLNFRDVLIPFGVIAFAYACSSALLRYLHKKEIDGLMVKVREQWRQDDLWNCFKARPVKLVSTLVEEPRTAAMKCID